MTGRDDERAAFAEVMERFAARADLAWSETAAAGLLGLTLPEDTGGQGAGPPELAALGTALGRHLSAGGYLGSAVLVGDLLAAGADRAVLTPWLTGERAWTTVLDAGGPLAAPHGDVSARAGSGVTVSTETALVADLLPGASLLVVSEQPTPLLLAVEAGAAGVTATATAAGDPTRTVTRLRLADVSAVVLAESAAVTTALDRTRRQAWLYLAAEALGAAEHCLERMVAFATVRTTFGRTIGSYQAVKHLCVDRWIEVESARALLDVALDEPAGSSDPTSLHLAVAAATEALAHGARDHVLVHGAIGFTWEHEAHRYLRRARAAQLVGGGPAWHRRQATGRLQQAYAVV